MTPVESWLLVGALFVNVIAWIAYLGPRSSE